MKSNRARMSPAEVSLYCQQIELLLQAGIPLHEGVRSLAENYQGGPYQHGMEALAQKVDETGSLCMGMQAAGLFPHYAQEMMRLGEKTGEMEQVCHGLASYYQREDTLRKAVRNAVTYPLVLLVMMACVIAVLLVRVLPIFRQVLGELAEVAASGAGGALASWGEALGYGVLIVVGLALLALGGLLGWYKLRPEQAEEALGRLFPPVRRLRALLTAARFSGVLEMTLRSGFPLEESLDLLAGVLTDRVSREKLAKCRQGVAAGLPFPQAVEQAGIFAPLYGKMIRLGFAAGKTDAVMAKLSQVYEGELDEGIGRLIGLIEPTLVAVLSLIIGGILLAVMLPLASILTTL